ncbi:MAG: uracil-DNA glycosylase [Betaproteobacteria bacterium]|nr:uracil-DNA glycosylase [Betaproteobacteria bacterium]
MSRKLILEEMGIAPLWRLRAPAGSDASQASAASATEAESAVADTPAPAVERAVAQPATEPASRVRKAGHTESMVTSSSSDVPEPASRAHRPAAQPDTDVAAKRRATPPLPEAEEAEARVRRQRIMQMDWAALKGSVAQCVACPLHRTRTQTVFGVGDERADWLFVGEGPGAEEDAKGEPFVGQAGRLLDNMLAAIEFERGKGVYIANVVKCRPPNNRNPEEREMTCCEPYLARQIELIEPRLIVALGRVAANHLLQTDASIASLRGRVHEYRGTPLIVTYHPAYLLRSLQEKAKAWVDLCFARATLDAIRKQRSASS